MRYRVVSAADTYSILNRGTFVRETALIAAKYSGDTVLPNFLNTVNCLIIKLPAEGF